MKNTVAKFRTNNLDLACVLVCNGHVCTTKKIGPVSAVFEFVTGSDVERAARDFYKGTLEVNITSFMYCRFAIKRELSLKSIEWEKARPGKIVLNPGEFYYFIADDSKPYKNVYANREPHIQRVMQGNVFRTMNEAQVAAANTKVD